jgi:hypothetical protein
MAYFVNQKHEYENIYETDEQLLNIFFFNNKFNGSELNDRRIYLLEMYKNIHDFAVPLWPWQWDSNYEDNCFSKDDYSAYKALEKMVNDGNEFRRNKSNANPFKKM